MREAKSSHTASAMPNTAYAIAEALSPMSSAGRRP
jgi:hypothetical protein